VTIPPSLFSSFFLPLPPLLAALVERSKERGKLGRKENRSRSLPPLLPFFSRPVAMEDRFFHECRRRVPPFPFSPSPSFSAEIVEGEEEGPSRKGDADAVPFFSPRREEERSRWKLVRPFPPPFFFSLVASPSDFSCQVGRSRNYPSFPFPLCVFPKPAEDNRSGL